MRQAEEEARGVEGCQQAYKRTGDYDQTRGMTWDVRSSKLHRRCTELIRETKGNDREAKVNDSSRIVTR